MAIDRMLGGEERHSPKILAEYGKVFAHGRSGCLRNKNEGIALNFRKLQKHSGFPLTTGIISANIKNCDKHMEFPKPVPGKNEKYNGSLWVLTSFVCFYLIIHR